MNRIRGHQPLFFASNKRPLGQFQLQFEVEKYFKGFLLMVEPELTFGRDGASTGHLFMTGKVEKPIVKHLSVVSEWGYHHNYGLDRKQWGPYHLPLDPARGYIYFGIELPFGSRD